MSPHDATTNPAQEWFPAPQEAINRGSPKGCFLKKGQTVSYCFGTSGYIGSIISNSKISRTRVVLNSIEATQFITQTYE